MNDLVPWNREIPPQVKRAKVYLGHGYIFGGVELPAGKYLVVHTEYSDDEATFFYRLPYHFGDKSAAKQRCTSFKGPRADKFSIDSSLQPNGMSLIRSIRFTANTEVHVFERSEIHFGRTYVLDGVELPKGKYLVVHKKDPKSMDAACMFVYRMPYRPGDEFVAKAHCMPK